MSKYYLCRRGLVVVEQGGRAQGCFPVPNYLHSGDVTAVKELTQIYWVSYLGKVKLGSVNRNEFEVCERDEDNTRSKESPFNIPFFGVSVWRTSHSSLFPLPTILLSSPQFLTSPYVTKSPYFHILQLPTNLR